MILIYNLATSGATPNECASTLNKAFSQWLEWEPGAIVISVQPCLAAWGNSNEYVRDHGFAMSLTITYRK